LEAMVCFLSVKVDRMFFFAPPPAPNTCDPTHRCRLRPQKCYDNRLHLIAPCRCCKCIIVSRFVCRRIARKPFVLLHVLTLHLIQLANSPGLPSFQSASSDVFTRPCCLYVLPLATRAHTALDKTRGDLVASSQCALRRWPLPTFVVVEGSGVRQRIRGPRPRQAPRREGNLVSKAIARRFCYLSNRHSQSE